MVVLHIAFTALIQDLRDPLTTPPIRDYGDIQMAWPSFPVDGRNIQDLKTAIRKEMAEKEARKLENIAILGIVELGV